MLQYGVLHITALSISYYLFGWIWGTVALIVFAYALGCILDLLGYQKMTFTDNLFTSELPNRYHNIVGFFSMEKIEFGEFKEEFYRRGILKIRRLRQIQINKFGIKFWKDKVFIKLRYIVIFKRNFYFLNNELYKLWNIALI